VPGIRGHEANDISRYEFSKWDMARFVRANAMMDRIEKRAGDASSSLCDGPVSYEFRLFDCAILSSFS